MGALWGISLAIFISFVTLSKSTMIHHMFTWFCLRLVHTFCWDGCVMLLSSWGLGNTEAGRGTLRATRRCGSLAWRCHWGLWETAGDADAGRDHASSAVPPSLPILQALQKVAGRRQAGLHPGSRHRHLQAGLTFWASCLRVIKASGPKRFAKRPFIQHLGKRAGAKSRPSSPGCQTGGAS